MQKTYYTIYKITNQINGKFYIGSHKTKNLNDGYMGSGKYLTRAQEKHGIDNFIKEILFVFDTPDEMYAKEAAIVNEDFISEENTYNLKVGGFGGFDYINSRGLNNSRRSNQDLRRLALLHIHRLKVDHEYADRRARIAAANITDSHMAGKMSKSSRFSGKKHSADTKKRMSAIAKERLKNPINNSQYGTRWVHSLKEDVA